MICKFCKVAFDPSRKAFIELRTFDVLEVQTKCPACGEFFYAIIQEADWFSNRDAKAILKKHNAEAAR